MVNIIAFCLDVAIYMGIYSILTISLNLEYGYTGLMNFGKVAFFMIGAYTTALLTISGASFIVGILAGVATAAIAGLLVSLPALRLRKDYLAILTLVFGEIVRIILKNEIWLAGGPFGLGSIPSAHPILREVGEELYLLINAAFVYGTLALFYLITERMVNSPYGRVLRGIREDEEVAQCLGKRTFRYKLQVFTVGSAMAGAAGGLYAQYIGAISTYMFMPIVTFTVVLMCILGGIANNKGAILGALLVVGFKRGTRLAKDYMGIPIDPTNLMYILTGVLIILFLLYYPGGILKEKPVKT